MRNSPLKTWSIGEIMCYECAYLYIKEKLQADITSTKKDNLSKSLTELLEHADTRLGYCHI